MITSLYEAHINGEKLQTCKEHCMNTARYAKVYAKGIGIENTAYLCGLVYYIIDF